MMQVGGIVGGVVLAIEQFTPSIQSGIPHILLTYGVAVSVSLLIFKGYYQPNRKGCAVHDWRFHVVHARVDLRTANDRICDSVAAT